MIGHLEDQHMTNLPLTGKEEIILLTKNNTNNNKNKHERCSDANGDSHMANLSLIVYDGVIFSTKWYYQ